MHSSELTVRGRRVIERRKRTSAFLLSLIIPGLGQFRRAKIAMGLTALILNAGFAVFMFLMLPRMSADDVVMTSSFNLIWIVLSVFNPGFGALMVNIFAWSTGIKTSWAFWLAWTTAYVVYYLLVAYDAYKSTRNQIAPCARECPAGINVPDYVALIASGRHEEALELVRETAPLAATLGRICPAPCEGVCTRTRIEDPIAIRALKRSAHLRSHAPPTQPQFKVRHRHKIAVVGAGPTGLTCAYFLAQRGYAVDIYDREEKPGGLLLTTIPCFRLPRKALEDDIDFILSSSKGIQFIGGKTLGVSLDLTELESSYHAVFLALGAAQPRPVMLEGEELEGVIPGLSFLYQICTGQKSYRFSSHVAVLGGGNTAVDSARAALRLGAKKVTVFYRRTREHMPAYAEEVIEAEKEGVNFEFLASPLKFEGKRKVAKIHLARMKMVDHGAGRRSDLEAVEGEEWVEDVEAVLVAIGQEAEQYVQEDHTLASDIRGNIIVHPLRYRTNCRKVFAGGDAIRGPATVVEAVGDGRRAARAIDFYLRPRFLGRFFERLCDFDPEFGVENVEGAAWTSRAPEVKPRFTEDFDFENVSLEKETVCGLAEGADEQEAKRCLRCQRYNMGFVYKKGEQKGYVKLDMR